MTRADDVNAEAAGLFEALAAEVEADRLDAPGPQGARLLRRIEGAATALRASGRRRQPRKPAGSG